jgi:hypothetical protein
MPFGSVIEDGLQQPFFFIMSDHSKESGTEGRNVENNIESIYSKLPEGKRWRVTIIGANHFSFSDQMLTKNLFSLRFFEGSVCSDPWRSVADLRLPAPACAPSSTYT